MSASSLPPPQFLPAAYNLGPIAAATCSQAKPPVAGPIADHPEILCFQDERVVAGDNTMRYGKLSLQIPETPHRHHDVEARVRVHEHPEGDLAVFHGPLRIGRYRTDGSLAEEAQRSAA